MTPTVATTTPSDASPSVRAWSPSATSAADPILRPTRMRYAATASLPTNPTNPATSTSPVEVTPCGWISRWIASIPATTADTRMNATITSPATSSARWYP